MLLQEGFDPSALVRIEGIIQPCRLDHQGRGRELFSRSYAFAAWRRQLALR